jgi:hypothetical protein
VEFPAYFVNYSLKDKIKGVVASAGPRNLKVEIDNTDPRIVHLYGANRKFAPIEVPRTKAAVVKAE